MKKYINGEYIDMTEEEISNLPKFDEETTEPTVLERIEAMEAVLLEGVLLSD